MLGASYDERWLSLKRNLFLFLAGWLAGTTEPSISNLYLSPVHHDEQKALAATGMSRVSSSVRTKADRDGSGNGSGRSVPQILEEAICEAHNTNVASTWQQP